MFAIDLELSRQRPNVPVVSRDLGLRATYLTSDLQNSSGDPGVFGWQPVTTEFSN